MLFRSLILLCLSLVLASPCGVAAPACEEVFQAEESALVGDYRALLARSVRPVGETRVLKSFRVQDQCDSHECYLFSFVGMLESTNLNLRQDTQAPAFSTAYLFAHKLLDWAEERLHAPEAKSRNYFLEGGLFPSALRLSRDHGLVPVESWKPLIPFHEWDFARLYRDIRQTTEETGLSAHAGPQVGSRGLLLNEAQARRSLPRVRALVERWTGPLPERVNFRGQDLSVHDVESLYGLGHQEHLSLLYPEGRFTYHEKSLIRNLRETTRTLGGTYSYEPANLQTLQSRMKQWIDSGIPVFVELQGEPIGHALLLVGYEHDGQGGVLKWKLQNSWGIGWSDRGTAWVDASDFHRHLRGAYFRSGVRAQERPSSNP